VIAHLKLEPHPEGGWFRETFRDKSGPHGRAHSTAILFLLKAGELSHWHKVGAAELWHWHGAPLLLEIKHGEALGLDPTGIKAIIRMRSCRRMPGKARAASAHGRWLAAPWRRGSTFPVSNWRRKIFSTSKRHGFIPPRGEG
jgi:hypothetical protein